MASLTELQNRKQLYLEAEAAVLKMQSYSLNGQTFTRADLGKIQAELAKIESQITSLQLANGNGATYACFRRF